MSFPSFKYCAGLSLIALGILNACGIKGPPLPPLIRMADRTRDLSIVQDGTQVILQWSYPQMTSAGEPLPDLEEVDLWRVEIPPGQEPSLRDSAKDRKVRENLIRGRGEIILKLSVEDLDRATRGALLEVKADLSPWLEEHKADGESVLWFAVVSICCSGRQSDFSNIARIVPTLPAQAPTDLKGEVEKTGIRLRWDEIPEGDIRLERSPDGKEWSVLETGVVKDEEFLDTNAEQGANWYYRARTVSHETSGAVHLGKPGETLRIDYPDIYAPPAPTDLVCLPENTKVRLRWQASPEAAVYSVERVAPGDIVKILARNTKKPSLIDTRPPAGELLYRVRALDASGNASEAAECRTISGRNP